MRWSCGKSALMNVVVVFVVVALSCATISAFCGPTLDHRRGDGGRTSVSKIAVSSSSSSSSLSSSDHGRFTHSIAVPVSENHDLLLELESVQRAVLSECPCLFESCIVPVMTRLPLLYVDAGGAGLSTGGLSSVAGRPEQATRALRDLVEEALEETLTSSSSSKSRRPLMVEFKGLEVDGEDNEVLHVLAAENSEGTETLRALVTTLRARIAERYGWRTMLPPDDQRQTNDDDGAFRPRVPFMRLPHDFEETLPPLAEDNEFGMRLPEEGGNGISPIFWYKWWDDEFASSGPSLPNDGVGGVGTNDDDADEKQRGVRLREVAVYARTAPLPGAAEQPLSERSFYAPSTRVTLPEGDAATTAREKLHEEYARSRLEGQLGKAAVAEEEELSELIQKTRAEYERQRFSDDDDVKVEKENDDDDDADEAVKDAVSAFLSSPSQQSFSSTTTEVENDDENEDEDDEEIEEKENNDEEDERKELELQKGIARIRAMLEKAETNPTYAAGSAAPEPAKTLPPFPSDEHFVGAWRLVSSPIHGDDDGDDGSSNLVLRVDHGVAGGPILNKRDRQKAAGGSWRFFRARWAGGGDGGGGGGETEQTRLRVDLLVPPERTQKLCFEGRVVRLGVGGTSGGVGGTGSGGEFAEAAFSALGATPRTEKDLGTMYCDGEVWVQDVVQDENDPPASLNRKKLGRFTATKLVVPATRGSLQYTIPPPRTGGTN